MQDEKKEPLTEATPLVKDESAPKAWHSFLNAHAWKVVFALVSVVAIAVLKTQLTAFLFSYSSVPTAYSFWSCVITDAIVLPVFILEWLGAPIGKHWGYPSMKALPTFLLICFFTLFDLMFTNIALSQIPAAIQGCIAATNPFWTLTIESVLYCKAQKIVIYATVSIICVGAVFTSLGEVDYVTAWGVVAAVLAVLSSASKYVFTHKSFRETRGNLGPLALLFWIDLAIAPILAIIAGAQGELTEMFKMATESAGMFWQFTGTAALGGVRALTQFIVLSLVSATSMATANTFTTSLNIVISMTWQDLDISPYLIAGVTLVICMAFLYTYLKADPEYTLIKKGLRACHLIPEEPPPETTAAAAEPLDTKA